MKPTQPLATDSNAENHPTVGGRSDSSGSASVNGLLLLLGGIQSAVAEELNLDSTPTTEEEIRLALRDEITRATEIIRDLAKYADRVARKYPQAVTAKGQDARWEAAMWLARFSKPNTEMRCGE